MVGTAIAAGAQKEQVGPATEPAPQLLSPPTSLLPPAQQVNEPSLPHPGPAHGLRAPPNPGAHTHHGSGAPWPPAPHPAAYRAFLSGCCPAPGAHTQPGASNLDLIPNSPWGASEDPHLKVPRWASTSLQGRTNWHHIQVTFAWQLVNSQKRPCLTREVGWTDGWLERWGMEGGKDAGLEPRVGLWCRTELSAVPAEWSQP